MFRAASFVRRYTTAAHSDARLRLLVNDFRSNAHMYANVNPLHAPSTKMPVQLFGFTESDVVSHEALREVAPGIAKRVRGKVDIATLVNHLQAIYCGTTSVEYDGLNEKERQWLSEAVERSTRDEFATPEDERRYATLVNRANAFDQFVHKKMRFVKRYGLEGEESMLVAMDNIFRACVNAKIQDVVIGMPHRGRSNLLAVLLRYPPSSLFAKMRGESLLPPGILGDDDVLSHIAQSVALDTDYGAPLRVSLLHNPSHLEAVYPVALGKARGRQDVRLGAARTEASDRRDLSLPVVMHGDAAVAGQGIVYESTLLARLNGYTTGGALHIVVNNQLGFTTPQHEARSSRYATDIAKVNGSPVFRVNAEDAPAVARASDLAVRYRREFGGDAWIDLIGYRRHGHNELDDPSFTQPTMYAGIAKRPSFAEIYSADITKRGIWSDDARRQLLDQYNAELEQEYQLVGTPAFRPHTSTHEGANWSAMAQGTATTMVTELVTGVERDVLLRVGEASVMIPSSSHVEVHPRLDKGHIDARRKKLASSEVDYATAEALAFGSLMLDGFDVRLSGQDAQRGTFSHRHAVLTCQRTGKRINPLDVNLRAPNVGRFEAINSPLSEAAVMSFDYGYSLQCPKTLVLWEAQFGDFANTAQVAIDQFITTGEHKWLRQSGLVLLLPHGYDGAGPEHSSAHIERFLQLSNEPFVRLQAASADASDDALHVATGPQSHLPNIVLINPTTPANYFHALRRQCLWSFRKPLIVIAPKTLLRLPECVSTLDEMSPTAQFRPVIADEVVGDHATEIVFCSGKIYYDLIQERKARHGDASTVAIVRVEQLTPFPYDAIEQAIELNGTARRVRWCQEEPQNQGAWSYLQPRFDAAFGGRCDAIQHVGPQALAMSATGIHKLHVETSKDIFKQLFDK